MLARIARRALGGLVVLAGLVALPTARPADAYEFRIHARSIGQGYELGSLRFTGPNLLFERRRFTTTLTLDIWDLGGQTRGLTLHQPDPDGPRVYVSTYLRLDHDFGTWTQGSLVVGGNRFDAVDLIPELEPADFAIDLLYGYVAVDGLWDDRIDLRAGRMLEVGSLDWWSYDGASVRAHTPLHVAVTAFGGLRVRDDSALGSNVDEPDGTSGAQCAEYVEGATPGSGSWRPIDRQDPGVNNPFANDFDFCPQRQQAMPTWGVMAATEGLPVWAQVSYRRTMSRTPGIIGPADRFQYPDVGLYPNDYGQAPGWGVNEEMVAASARGSIDLHHGRAQLIPEGAVRYSLLHGLFDQALAGVRARWGMHSLQPEIYYSFPTFDGDSLFNVFSSEPYTDYRLTYDLAPRKTPWRAYARGWLRQFHTEDPVPTDAMTSAPSDRAGGVQVGGRWRSMQPSEARPEARLDLFHEDGYGGRRTGGYLSGRLSPRRTVRLSGRASVINFDEDLLTGVHGTTVGVQLGATYLINFEGVALHLMVEESSNRIYRSQFRVIGVLDLAFEPEI